MITDALIYLIISTINFFLGFFPYGGTALPTAIETAWATVTTLALQWDNVIPVTELLVAFSLYVTAWLFVFVWLMIKWLIQVIRK